MLELRKDPVHFDLALGREAWDRTLAVLQSGEAPSPHDGYAGLVLTDGTPIFFERVSHDLHFEIDGKRTVAPKTSAKVLAEVRRTGWTDPVTIQTESLTFFIRRAYWLTIRDACLAFARARKSIERAR